MGAALLKGEIMMKDRGSALMTAVISIMILISISGVFFSMVISQAKIESSEEKGLKAYYLAEAGVQYGIARALSDIEDGVGIPTESETIHDPFDQGGNSEFKVVWEDIDGLSFKVTSKATYSGITREKAAGYLYE